MKTGIELIAEERLRQINEERRTLESDDANTKHEMPRAAACYALSAGNVDAAVMVPIWPWATHWWKPSTPIRDLVKAGALIAAEIDRLQRIEQRHKDMVRPAPNTP